MQAMRDTLLTRAIGGVLSGAQDGELPLFAWTLGMPQRELLGMVQRCFPELDELDPGDTEDYERLLKTMPDDFHAMVDMLIQSPVAGDGSPERDWLARAIAAASFGERHLWEDLGLFSREDVTTLLTQHFPDMAQRNTRGLKWKRFLFQELSRRLNRPDLMPAGCAECEEFHSCAQTLVPFPERDPLDDVL